MSNTNLTLTLPHAIRRVMEDSTSNSIYDIHAETRAKLDEEIERLAKRLHALRSARNELAPIARLPVEVMREIFLLARYSVPGAYGETSLVLSGVSQLWRDLALGISHLWSTITVPHPEWMAACMTRSRNLPLDLDFVVDLESEDPDAIPVIFRALPRVRNFSMVEEDDKQQLSFLPLDEWEGSSSQLTSLTLHYVSLPKAALGTLFPCLATLVLKRSMFYLDPTTIPTHLVKLEIRKSHLDTPLTTILEVLQFTPALEELILDDTVEKRETESQLPETRIHLSKIRRMLIMGHRADVTIEFLQYITVPLHIELYIDVISGYMVDNLSVVEAIETAGQLLSRSFKGLLLSMRPECINFYLDDMKPFEGKTPVGIDFNLYTYAPPSSRSVRLLEPLRSALSSLEMLVLNGEGDIGEDLYLAAFEMFGTFNNLRTLQVFEDFLPSFLKYVTTTPRGVDEEVVDNQDVKDLDRSPIPFPALIDLSFVRACFSDDDLDSLRNWLKTREIQSLRLSKLSFYRDLEYPQAESHPTEVTQLRGIVELVDEVVFREGKRKETSTV